MDGIINNNIGIGIGIMGNLTAMTATAEEDDSEGKCEPYAYVEAGFESKRFFKLHC
jgi:hypothetical protein